MIEATIAALAEHGFAALSVEDIATRAGVHKTTVYRRWPELEDLVLDALLDRSEAEIELIDTGDLRDDLLALVADIVGTISSPVGRALIATAITASAPKLEPVRQRFWDMRFGLVKAILRRAVERGDIPGTVNTDLVIEMLVAPLYFRLLVTRKPLSPRFRASVVDLVLASIGYQSPATQPAARRPRRR